MTPTLLLLSTALAATDPVASIGAPVPLGQGGAWARPLPRPDGSWALAFATQDGLYAAPLLHDGTLEGWTLQRDARWALTSEPGLKDHAITRCPDGTYLHIASANTDQPNDTAWAFRTDADLQPVSSAAISVADGSLAHNDMPIVCSERFQGTAFAAMGGTPGNTWFGVAPDASLAETTALAGDPRSNGSGFLADGELLHHVGYGWPPESAWINTYDAELQLVEQRQVRLLDGELEGFWPQGVLKVGDLMLVAVMGFDPTVSAQQLTGEVWLVVLDADFSVVARHQLTSFLPGQTPARPWLARQDEWLLVGFDQDNQSHVQAVQLDLEGVGEIGDSGTADDEDEDEGEDEGAKDGGCATGGGAAGLGLTLLAAAAAGRRRRR
jgi:MYXO-CTERM domain-containing protein